MAKRQPKPVLDDTMQWTATLTRFKDGRLVCYSVGEEMEKIGEDFFNMAKDLGFDVEQDRMIKLKQYRDIKENIRLLALTILEVVK